LIAALDKAIAGLTNVAACQPLDESDLLSAEEDLYFEADQIILCADWNATLPVREIVIDL
jgi:hypothetical protein